MDKVVDTQDKTRNKWKIIGIILGIIIAIFVVISFTYAYWLITKEQTNDNTLGTGCFNITFTSNTEGINLAQTYPISNSEGMATSPYSFTITNTCDIVAEYYVNSEILDTSTLNPLYVKGVLNDKIPKVLTEYTEVETTLEDATDSYRLISGYLEEGESITYEYRQWMSDTTPYGEGTNETFESKITIFSSPVTTVCGNCGTLMVASGSAGDQPFLYGPITKYTIESLEFKSTTAIPSDAIGSWDVSEEQDGSVMAWYKDIDNNTLNEVFIGGNGGVKANSNSERLFYNLIYLYSLDLTNLYTIKVTNMEYMFWDTGVDSTTFTLDLGENFDTSKVINMAYMFMDIGENSTVFTLDLGDKFDTSNVADMRSMFNNTGFASEVFTLNLGDKFDTSNVTAMSGMFGQTGRTSEVFTLDLGDKFDTSNIINMYGMFTYVGYSSPIFTLDLGDKFDMSNVTNMGFMFALTGYRNPNFYIKATNTDWNSSATTTNMFYGSKVTPKFYAKDAYASSFIVGAGFPGTVYDCSSVTCP